MCSHAKLSEESELSTCEPPIVIKLAFERVSLYREGDIRCELPRSRVPVPKRERMYELRKRQ
jgi:hypothetical protein